MFEVSVGWSDATSLVLDVEAVVLPIDENNIDHLLQFVLTCDKTFLLFLLVHVDLGLPRTNRFL